MNLYRVNWTHNGSPRSVIGLAETPAEASAYVKSHDTQAKGQLAADDKAAQQTADDKKQPNAEREPREVPEVFSTFHMGEVTELFQNVYVLGPSVKLLAWTPTVEAEEAAKKSAAEAEARAKTAPEPVSIADAKAQKKADAAEEKAEEKREEKAEQKREDAAEARAQAGRRR